MSGGEPLADFDARIPQVMLRQLGEDGMLFETDSIAPGHDLIQPTLSALIACVVVGRLWLDARLPACRRRRDQPADCVRSKPETALQRRRLVPVRILGATMSRPDGIPAGLAAFARLKAVAVDHRMFQANASQLVQLLVSSR